MNNLINFSKANIYLANSYFILILLVLIIETLIGKYIFSISQWILCICVLFIMYNIIIYTQYIINFVDINDKNNEKYFMIQFCILFLIPIHICLVLFDIYIGIIN